MGNGEVKEICQKIKLTLANYPNLIAIFNNGSTVVGTDTPGSDVDFTIVVKDKKDIPKVLGLLKASTEYLGIDHEVPHFKYKRSLGVCVYDIKTMEFFADILYKSKDNFLKWQKVLQHKIVEAVAVYDPQNILPKLQKKVLPYPAEIRNTVFLESISNLKRICSRWGKHGFKNEFNFVFHLPEILENICLALYSKNKRLFMIPFKRLHKDLKELEPNIENEMYFLVQGTNSQKNLKEKRVILKTIIKKLER